VGGCADQCCGRVGRTDTSAYAINNRSLLSEADAETGEKEGEVPGTTRINGVLYPLMLAMKPLALFRSVPFWAGYGASSTVDVMGTGKLPYISLVTAFFIGMGGTKWLQSERDKGRWQAAAGSSALARQHHQLQLKLNLSLSDQTPQIAAAAFKRFSPAGPRTGGGEASNQSPGGSLVPNLGKTLGMRQPHLGKMVGMRARVPAELGDGVRAVGPPQQASGSG
jgi:hypothetical protein